MEDLMQHEKYNISKTHSHINRKIFYIIQVCIVRVIIYFLYIDINLLFITKIRTISTVMCSQARSIEPKYAGCYCKLQISRNKPNNNVLHECTCITVCYDYHYSKCTYILHERY